MSVEEFQDYWRSKHSLLIQFILGVKRYAQCHTLLSGYRREPPPLVDGLEEIHFETPKEIHSMANTPAYKAAQDDLANFVDLGKFQTIVADEILIKPGSVSPDMVKNIEFVRRKPGMALDPFHHYWQNIHGPLAAKIGQIRRYVQSHTLMGEYTKDPPPPYDGTAETWFESTAAMRQSAASPEYAATREDEKNFASGERQFVITREVKII